MRTSKLLELAALLKQYAASAPRVHSLMAQSLARNVETEAKVKERMAAIEEQCDMD